MDTEQFLLIGAGLAMLALVVIITIWYGVVIERMSHFVSPDTMKHILDTVKDMGAQQALNFAKRSKTPLDDPIIESALTQAGYTIEEQPDGTWKPIRKSAPIDPPQ